MKMKRVKPAPKPRNPFYQHPLMRKGAVHQKSNKALRNQNKRSLRREWSEQSLFLTKSALLRLFLDTWCRSYPVWIETKP